MRMPFPPPSPHITILLATRNPDLAQLEKQLDSIKNQTYPHWTCLLTDDLSEENTFRKMTTLVQDDPRFTMRRNTGHLGHYHTFEEALFQIKPDVDLVCLAEPDAVWGTDRLS